MNTGNRNNGPQDLTALWEAFRGLRDNFTDYRPRFGEPEEHDLQTTVLGLLAEGPHNGAEVIRDIADRATDSWRPGAAEVYPMLQFLVDEGLATVTEEEGRRTYALTDAGLAEASPADGEDADDDWTPPWLSFAKVSQFAGSRGELPRSGLKLGQAVRQVVLTGDEDQRTRVSALLDDTRRRVYGILAEDAAESAGDTDRPTDDE